MKGEGRLRPPLFVYPLNASYVLTGPNVDKVRMSHFD